MIAAKAVWIVAKGERGYGVRIASVHATLRSAELAAVALAPIADGWKRDPHAERTWSCDCDEVTVTRHRVRL